MSGMTKKERIDAVFEGREPDRVPVFPFILTQGVYECGWKLPDITTQTEIDPEKSAATVFKTLEVYDYDLALGSYYDCYYGLVPLGGVLRIPEGFGEITSASKFPVTSREDWAEVKKKMPLDPRKDGRVASMLKSIKKVSKKIGHNTPISAIHWAGPTSALLMLRGPEPLIMDMVETPDLAAEMFEASTQFAIDILRAQYEAGANSICIIGEVLGVEMITPEMCEQYVLPSVAKIAKTIMKEFGQKTLLHIHGDFSKPAAYPLVEKFIKEGHIHGLYFDEKHSGKWVKDNVRDKFNIPVCLPIHGPDLASWSPDEIEAYVKDTLSYAAPGGGVMMTPSCEIPPDVSQERFLRWMQSVKRYGTYPINQ